MQIYTPDGVDDIVPPNDHCGNEFDDEIEGNEDSVNDESKKAEKSIMFRMCQSKSSMSV